MSIERIDFDRDTGRILYSCHYFSLYMECMPRRQLINHIHMHTNSFQLTFPCWQLINNIYGHTRSLLIVDWLVKVRSANSSLSMPHLRRARVKSCSFKGMAKTLPRLHFGWSSGNCLVVISVS